MLGKYSKFASAGEKAQVRQEASQALPDTTPSADLGDDEAAA